MASMQELELHLAGKPSLDLVQNSALEHHQRTLHTTLPTSDLSIWYLWD